MKNINNVTNILNFYVKANKLKTTRQNKAVNRSVADNIYMSIILAVGFFSEFKQFGNLTEVIEMLILSNLNEDDIKTLNDYQELSKLLIDYRLDMGASANLANKCKELNNRLSKIMEDVSLSKEEKLNEIIKVLSPVKDKDYTSYKDIACFYMENYKLTNIIRSGWDDKHWNVSEKDIRVERISDHIVSTLALVMAFKSELNYNLDYDKIFKTLAIHEIGETVIGDITPFDNMTKEEKKAYEHKAMETVLGGLYKKDELLQNLFDFDDLKTEEDLFSHYIDKIEADLQSKVYQDNHQQRSLTDQENNCVFKSKKVQDMIFSGLAKTAFDVWYYYDISIYEDERFVAFKDLLKLAKSNNLFNLDKNVINEDIDLTKEESYILESKIVSAINTFKQDKGVESILLSTKQNDESGIIYITILYNTTIVDNELIEFFNRHFNEQNSKVKIIVRGDNTYRYLILRDHPMEYEKYEELMESTVVYDKCGLTNLRKERANAFYTGHEKRVFDVVTYNPPIIEKVLKRYE